MPTESEKLRQALVGMTRQINDLSKIMGALRESILAFHRDFVLEIKRQKGECTCPWNQHPLEPQRGHHVQCPSLRGEHSSDDMCVQKDVTKGHSDEEL